MADGSTPALSLVDAALSEAASRGAGRIAIVIDLSDGYDPSDGRIRCHGVGTCGPGGNVAVARKSTDLAGVLLALLEDIT